MLGAHYLVQRLEIQPVATEQL